MSDQQINDGYDRLETALAAPLDADQRVAERLRVRRRNRRIGVATATTVVVTGLAGTTLLLSGGDDPDGSMVATDPPPGSTLVMTRPDGSTYAFPDVTVSCDPPTVVGGGQLEEAAPDTIWAYSPILLDGPLEGEKEPLLEQPFVMIEGTVSKLQDGRVLEMPIDGPGNSDTYPMVLFIADTEGGKPRDPGNEVASSAGGTGTVRVLEASCDPTPVLRLEVDAVLGSEEEKQDLTLTGELR